MYNAHIAREFPGPAAARRPAVKGTVEAPSPGRAGPSRSAGQARPSISPPGPPRSVIGHRMNLAEVMRARGHRPAHTRFSDAHSRCVDIEATSIPDIPIPVSRIGLGTWAMGGLQWGGADDDESVRTIHAVLERGINLIDTAPAYGFGRAEEVVGRALAERGGRDRVVIATKAGV